MLIWLAASLAALGLLAAVGFFFFPLALSSNVQGRAEPSGSWALAFGVAVGPLALTVIGAAAVPPFVTCHVFGKQLLRLPLSRWLRRAGRRPQPKGEQGPITPAKPGRAERALGSFMRTLDPIEIVLSWWEKERVFEVRSLVVETEYSFRDVALTGQILAGMYMLSGILPERYEIHQTPIWETEDRVSFAADGRFRIWLGRLLVDLVGFVLKQAGANRRARRESVAIVP